MGHKGEDLGPTCLNYHHRFPVYYFTANHRENSQEVPIFLPVFYTVRGRRGKGLLSVILIGIRYLVHKSLNEGTTH